MHLSKLFVVLHCAKAKYCLKQSLYQAPLSTPPSEVKSIWVEKGNFWSSKNVFLLCTSNVVSKQTKSLELMTVSVHVNKLDHSQFFSPEDEQCHAIPSPLAHLSSARNRVASFMQPFGQGAWAVPCLTPPWDSGWHCASGHRLDLCQAKCQQATSLLVHWFLSPCPDLLQLLQIKQPRTSQGPETDLFAWFGANLSSWAAHINSDIIDEYLIQSHICSPTSVYHCVAFLGMVLWHKVKCKSLNYNCWRSPSLLPNYNEVATWIFIHKTDGT